MPVEVAWQWHTTRPQFLVFMSVRKFLHGACASQSENLHPDITESIGQCGQNKRILLLIQRCWPSTNEWRFLADSKTGLDPLLLTIWITEKQAIIFFVTSYRFCASHMTFFSSHTSHLFPNILKPKRGVLPPLSSALKGEVFPRRVHSWSLQSYPINTPGEQAERFPHPF